MKRHGSHGLARLAVVVAVWCASALSSVAVEAQTTPADAARALLLADRAFSAASAEGDAVTGLARSFARDIVLPVRGEAHFARGYDAAVDALRRDTVLAGGRLTWTPIRGGISADGSHGFTYGYTTLRRGDGTTVPGKYVAYWERERGEWRVSVYRRAPRPAGDVSLDERPSALPAAMVGLVRDSVRHRQLVDELAETERAFSRESKGGVAIGAAFARYGDPSAANVGGEASFTFGAEAIGRSVQASIAPGTSITWGPDETRVASSGDLGVTIGIITIRPPTTAGAEATVIRVPYFTIWRRDDTGRPWRYIAE